MFERLTNDEWTREYKARIPEIAKKAKTARVKDSSLGSEEGMIKRGVRLGKAQYVRLAGAISRRTKTLVAVWVACRPSSCEISSRRSP